MTTRDESVTSIERIEGWLRPAQAERLWDLASAVPSGGQIVEIGSYQGKSTVVLASAARDDVRVVAIDPHAGNDRGPGEWHGSADDGQADHEAFLANLRAGGVDQRVTHVREFSQRAHGLVDGTIDLLYIDGAHGYAPADDDISTWGARVVPGGAMAIHDVNTSLFVTAAVLRRLLISPEWTYEGKIRSMALYRRQPVAGTQRLTNAGRQLANIPWFIRNLAFRSAGAIGLGAIAARGEAPGGGFY